jgi:murein DD-endopeptidase MepM/ murein hydrolase activator NlpD
MGRGTASIGSALSRIAVAAIGVVFLFGLWLAGPAQAHAASLATLRQQLADLRAQAAPITDAYDAAVTALQNTQYRIGQTNKRITAATKKLATSQDTLASRADTMYREGGDLGIAEFVLGAESWDDFVTRLDLMTLIATSDADLVQDVKDTRAGLLADRASLVKDAAAEKQDVSVASQKQAVMDAALVSKKNEYDRVLAAIAAQMPAGTGSFPPGPDGLIFPVQGMHSYSDTWGAPRSGGRHHMGTDIMSPRGTPVVAVCSGSARPHWNNLGGNSITLSGNNGWVYYYAHLDHYAVKNGHVKAGQVIGYVGNTGDAAGGPCHLHFQMGPGGRWVDPYPYLRRME